jgi:ssDNA-binding Zn-finger/Zn-ribbon topoisomerase 1
MKHDFLAQWPGKKLLQIWLGESAWLWNIPSDPDDICALVRDIKGRRCRFLTFQNYPANPNWIKEKWRTKTGVLCPQCGQQIQALLKNHRTRRSTITGRRPCIFCGCVRLNPSALPALQFFTANWLIVIEIYNGIVAAARELHAELAKDQYNFLGRIENKSRKRGR